MTNVETNYFSVNKFLLLALGLWPYQQSNLTRIQFIFLSSILTTHVIFQCTVFISQRCTTDLITKILSSVCFFAIFVIKYNMFFVNLETVKDLLGQLLHICNELKDGNEIAIMNKYRCIGKRYTVSLTVLGGCCIFFSTFFLLWLNIFNITLPTNKSRSDELLIMTEYFIDQKKYFNFIMFHSIASLYIGATVIIATGTMLLAYLHYVCGMFKIASYRIERAMNINMLQNINQMKYIFIYKGLICAVNIHRRAMSLTTDLLSSIEIMMFCLILFGVLSVSLNLFRIFQILSVKESVKQCVIPFIFTLITVLYMFLSNYIGQVITNHNEHIFTTAYNVKWYIAPLCIQKTILFLLQKNYKNFTLNISGLFTPSIECFATLVKTSVSYFTVIYSTQ
ncbi:Odorant receptor 314 [Nylanderia fulva]|uniref:Odorant receptor n=1 Tax=Nylanderia fulva TaxID=613905 RepID=A0A6G1LR22_9HYME|nr:uncharacterized protein LOC114945538 [Nylanderia fulva]KAF3054229.1 Odorant receptor 314 [Nylanderia fulva]